VVVDKDPILYPYVHNPHLMVVMSQDAFKKFSPELRKDGILLYEEDLVKPEGLPPTVKAYGIPATRFAEELGRKMVLNIVMVGFFTAVTGLVSEKAAKEAVSDSVPPNTIDLNMKAFDKGFQFGKKLLQKN
jgi:2-oxoglutarate ferredoxin oxidoreductase subunit gamma